jgi:EAL domain-containing protein (putative c-di-GMP-specific phosphodiesterase class I)
MYRAKERGRNNYQFYTAALTANAVERFQMEVALRQALERDELVLYFQPKVNLADGKTYATEALVRWRHPELGLVAPDRFIPLAEETGLIQPIGVWVLRTACEQMKQWLDMGLPLQHVAVNLSGMQILHGGIVTTVWQVLQETGLKPQYLELEITESVIMGHAEETIRVLDELRDLGVSLAIDDFGTGYSSLSYLKRFPIDTLKIDRSFVRDTPDDANDAAIIRAVIALGRSLQLEIVAEGVETAEQQEFLLKEGCDTAQGYLFSRPVPAAWLTENMQNSKG